MEVSYIHETLLNRVRIRIFSIPTLAWYLSEKIEILLCTKIGQWCVVSCLRLGRKNRNIHERRWNGLAWKKRKEDWTIVGAMIRSLISNMKLTKLDCTFGNRQHEALSLCSFHRAISAFTSVKENDSPGQFGLFRYRVRSNWDRSSV